MGEWVGGWVVGWEAYLDGAKGQDSAAPEGGDVPPSIGVVAEEHGVGECATGEKNGPGNDQDVGAHHDLISERHEDLEGG